MDARWKSKNSRYPATERPSKTVCFTNVAQCTYIESVADENCNLFSISKYGLKGDKWTKIGKLLL
jgi:hypothetical protein